MTQVCWVCAVGDHLSSVRRSPLGWIFHEHRAFMCGCGEGCMAFFTRYRCGPTTKVSLTSTCQGCWNGKPSCMSPQRNARSPISTQSARAHAFCDSVILAIIERESALALPCVSSRQRICFEALTRRALPSCKLFIHLVALTLYALFVRMHMRRLNCFNVSMPKCKKCQVKH